MCFTMKSRFSATAVVLTVAAAGLGDATIARAETAYISQATGNLGSPVIGPAPASLGINHATGFSANGNRQTPSLPELAAPRITGGNYASTLQIGSYNTVFQAQSGYGNVSNVGIIGGNHNAVGVLQAGNNLRSNLVLLGTSGTSVGVLQGNGAAPLNVLIGRLPNGALVIGGLPIRR
ncbi:hypothetical protein DNX69_06305 [Rhodopseudomonas palustris]|uniref:Uncharacterized protein n=1 Tax=Rhodopseudomonas palustris TaxID=1076 RepID=A0A323UII0_RHOPL|nr:hypothetical protein [Rhodopseudomonas palustris]PZA12802.1 hypothetical protein DNX69_06305 [Rhodopseudomonas palustris]